jgi:putative ubiquitin-RnfH superfamily antitoxin RatB of RatAB toxin-antitoxin module
MHSLKERENFVIDETIRVEVAYAKCDIQRLLEIQVIAGTTARDAVRLSGLGDEFPEVDVSICPIGLYGSPIDGRHIVREGDRIEIYRPLERDPRDARRELAARGLTISRAEVAK